MKNNDKNNFKKYYEFFFLIFYIFIYLFTPIKSNENYENRNPFYKSKRLSLGSGGSLTNIININISFLRYLHFASYSNGDMILQSGSYPNSVLRFFISFKKNGTGFSRNNTNNEYSYFYSLNINNYANESDIGERYESKNIVIKLSGEDNNNKSEYLISIWNGNYYVEIYDFENDKIYRKLLYDFSEMKSISSYQNMAISLFSNNSDYYYLFWFIGYNSKT